MWKECNCCKVRWEDITGFLNDPNIKFIGMQLYLKTSDFRCLYHFDHTKCGSTLGIKIERFEGMIDEPIPRIIMAGQDACPRHCTDVKDFMECTNECHNAPFRRYAINVLSKLD